MTESRLWSITLSSIGVLSYCGCAGPRNVIQQKKGFLGSTADIRLHQGYEYERCELPFQINYILIPDILITTKPRLEDPKPAVLPTLIRDLHRVTSLAESFIEHRPRSNKNWIHLVDTLDQEGRSGIFFSCCLSGPLWKKIPTGVNLWNISGLVRKTPEDDGRSLVAACRLYFSFLISSESYHISWMREMK